MKVQEIREMAQRMSISAAKLKKGDLIREIQKAEGNCACFGSGRSTLCGQPECLWIDDCD